MFISESMWANLLSRVHVLELQHDRNEIMSELKKIEQKIDALGTDQAAVDIIAADVKSKTDKLNKVVQKNT